jgi:hypothetical protein
MEVMTMTGVESTGIIIPPTRFQAKLEEKTAERYQQALALAKEHCSTIETYLSGLSKLSDLDRRQILTSLTPVTRLVPLLEDWIIELVRSEMMEENASDYDADTPNNVPRGRELADWNKALALGKSLLPIPEFDFTETYRQFLVTADTDPDKTLVFSRHKVALWELRQQPYVPRRCLMAEKFFLISLRMLRFQYHFGTSQETLLENAKADLAQG